MSTLSLTIMEQRFVDPEIRTILDPVTDIKGLYLTGQDTVLCGVTLCQVKKTSCIIVCFIFAFTSLSLVYSFVFVFVCMFQVGWCYYSDAHGRILGKRENTRTKYFVRRLIDCMYDEIECKYT